MQNNPNIPQDAIIKAANIWKTTSPEQREDEFKRICQSHNVSYTQSKAKVIEAIRNKDPQMMRLIASFQRMHLR